MAWSYKLGAIVKKAKVFSTAFGTAYAGNVAGG